MIVDQAPSAEAPKPVQTAIVIWGDTHALTKMKKQADLKNWLTSWAKTPDGYFSLFIAVDRRTPRDDISAFLDSVNHKQFGDLSAGFADIGVDQK